jgi:iron complex transport system substrate-binding protein
MDRIVSLAPSATATIRALGATDRLVGVTTHDDLPGVPEIGGWLNPDLDRVAALDPDLIVTSDALQSDVRDALEGLDSRVFHSEPATLSDVLASFQSLGEAIGDPDAGQRLRRAATARVDAVRAATPDDPSARPTVYSEEWHDPPMAAGNWVPDVVRAAGGHYPFVAAGSRSQAVEVEAVERADPDYVVVHHCGLGESATPGIDVATLDAELVVLDDDLLNQPSPRLLDGLERLAELLHDVAVQAVPRTEH